MCEILAWLTRMETLAFRFFAFAINSNCSNKQPNIILRSAMMAMTVLGHIIDTYNGYYGIILSSFIFVCVVV